MLKLRELVVLSSIIIAFSMIYRQFIMDLEFQLLPNSESFLFMYLLKGKILNVLSCIITAYGKYIIIFPVIYFFTKDDKIYDYIITSQNDLWNIVKMSVLIISGVYVLSEGIFEIGSSITALLKSKVSFFGYFDKDIAIVSIIKIATGLIMIKFQKKYLSLKAVDNINSQALPSIIPVHTIISVLLTSALLISVVSFVTNIYRNSFNINVMSKDIIPLIVTLCLLFIMKFYKSNYSFLANKYLKYVLPFLCCSYIYFIKFCTVLYISISHRQGSFNFLILYASISIILSVIFLILSLNTKILNKQSIV